jgi:hypothetical protein
MNTLFLLLLVSTITITALLNKEKKGRDQPAPIIA